MAEAEDAARRHVILTELFGVHPRAIVDALVVSANEHLYLVGEQLEQTVRGLLGDTTGAEREAERGVHAILTLMESVIDHVMDIFELYCLRSIFVITPEQSRRITLRHHRGLDLRAEEVWDGEAPAGPVPVVPEGEEALHRKIASHRLAQAERAAKVRLERAEMVRAAYAFILHDAQRLLPDEAPVDVARGVRDAVPGVCTSMGALQAVHPLHRALLAPAVKDEGEGLEDTPREWEKGRDEYLNWEASRIIATMKQKRRP